VLVGNGFELPPVTDPLPRSQAFLGNKLTQRPTQRTAVDNANGILRMSKGAAMACLRSSPTPTLIPTFPELDHYGARTDARVYRAAGWKAEGTQVDWPGSEGPRFLRACGPTPIMFRRYLLRCSNSCAVVCVATGSLCTAQPTP